MIIFFQLAHFSYDMEHLIIARWLTHPYQDHSNFPHNFQSSYEILIHCQSEDSLTFKQLSYKSPQL